MLNYGANIALFPLNTVLFPGMMLPLHIFEERYKIMIKRCLAGNNFFGVVLAKTRQAQLPNVATLYGDDLYDIGTTAKITAIEQLADERMNLITVGQERFIIRSISASQDDFLMGQVDPWPMRDNETAATINRLMEQLKPLVRQYIDYLAAASGEDLSEARLPTDPKTLAYLAGTAIQSPLPDKQTLLAAESLSALMVKTGIMLDRENKILAYMLRAYQAHQQVERLPFIDYSLN